MKCPFLELSCAFSITNSRRDAEKISTALQWWPMFIWRTEVGREKALCVLAETTRPSGLWRSNAGGKRMIFTYAEQPVTAYRRLVDLALLQVTSLFISLLPTSCVFPARSENGCCSYATRAGASKPAPSRIRGGIRLPSPPRDGGRSLGGHLNWLANATNTAGGGDGGVIGTTHPSGNTTSITASAPGSRTKPHATPATRPPVNGGRGGGTAGGRGRGGGTGGRGGERASNTKSASARARPVGDAGAAIRNGSSKSAAAPSSRGGSTLFSTAASVAAVAAATASASRAGRGTAAAAKAGPAQKPPHPSPPVRSKAAAGGSVVATGTGYRGKAAAVTAAAPVSTAGARGGRGGSGGGGGGGGGGEGGSGSGGHGGGDGERTRKESRRGKSRKGGGRGKGETGRGPRPEVRFIGRSDFEEIVFTCCLWYVWMPAPSSCVLRSTIGRKLAC